MTRRITKTGLRKAIHEHLLGLGFSRNGHGYLIDGELSKKRIRALYAPLREERLRKDRSLVTSRGQELTKHFADGKEVDPQAIDPELVEVASGTPEADLFRFATLLWSVPVSQGFGRRLRFLVRDCQNGKLIGVFALGDPVFNLSARDDWIGWTSADRAERLVHVMDGYVIGAVPPYSLLIGGKLVAALMASLEVKQAYERKYLERRSVISAVVKRARLVLLTTTSALGRSSLYNRLSVPSGPHFIRVGKTIGYGHFHLSGDLFEMMRSYLEQSGHPYASGHRFGMGPNRRLRVIRTVLEDIGMDGNRVLRHGVEREVYAVPLALNWREVLLGRHKRVRGSVLPASVISEFCIQRWLVPRAARDARYRNFSPSSITGLL